MYSTRIRVILFKTIWSQNKILHETAGKKSNLLFFIHLVVRCF